MIDMIGDRLKELREGAGLNQPEFAKIAGTSKQYVGRLESGLNKDPNANFILAWARRFNVRMEWIVSGELPKASQSMRQNISSIADAIRLLEHLAPRLGVPMPQITPASLFVAMEIIRAEEVSPNAAEIVDFQARYVARLREVEAEHGDLGRKAEAAGGPAGGSDAASTRKAKASAGKAG